MTLEDELQRGLSDLARGAGSSDGLAPDIRSAAARRRTRMVQARAAIAVAGVGALVIGFVAWRGSGGDDVRTVPVAPDTTAIASTSPRSTTPDTTPVSTSPVPTSPASTTAAPSNLPTIAASGTFAGATQDGAIAEFDLATGKQLRVLEPPPSAQPAAGAELTVVHGQVYVLRHSGSCDDTLQRLGDKRDPLINSSPTDELSAFAISPDGLSMAWVLTKCDGREATLIVQMANAPTVREIKIGVAPPSVNDLSLANDGRVALGLSSSAANAQTVGLLSSTATVFGDLKTINVPDGCEAARPRFLNDGSLTVVSCAGSDPAKAAVFRLVDTAGPMTKLFDLEAVGEGHATGQILCFDWNDAGDEAIIEVRTGLLYRWSAGSGIVGLPSGAVAVGF